MNIILVASSILPRSIGGIEVLTVLLAQAFEHLGHQVTIITGGNGGLTKRYGVTILELPELMLPLRLKSFLMPWYAWRLQQRLARERIILEADIINTVDLDSIIALAGWKPTRDRLVATIQDYGLVCANGLLLDGSSVCPNHCHEGRGFLCLTKRRLSIPSRLYLECAYRVRKWYRDHKMRHIRYAISVSRFVADQIKRYVPNVSPTIIGNCIPEIWRNTSIRPQSKRPIDVLYAGRLESFKGIGVFLASVPEIIKRVPSFQCVIAGGGNARRWQNMASSLGIEQHVSFAGPQEFSGMAKFYQQAKILVVPSFWPEPCGRVIIEGMHFGCAIISTNRGGTPELIDDGKNGILVPANDNSTLAHTISNLLTHPKRIEQLGGNAHIAALTRFQSLTIARAYLSYYQRVVAGVI